MTAWLFLGDIFIAFGVGIVFLTGLAVLSHGWTVRALGRWILAVLVAISTAVLDDKLHQFPSLPRLAVDLLLLMPFVFAPFTASNWTFRDLLRFLPALVSVALVGSPLWLGIFCIVSFGSPNVRKWLQTDEPTPASSLMAVVALGAVTLSLADVAVCIVAQQIFPPFEWFSIGSMEPLDRPEVWILLASNALFFLLVGSLLVACSLLARTTVPWRIVVWLVVALVGAGIATRFQGRALTFTASLLLSSPLIYSFSAGRV